MHRAQLGDRARIRYSRVSAQINDKKELTRSKIIEFIVGSHEIPARISRGLIGMALGDHRHFRVWMAEDGRLEESAVRRVGRDRLGSHRELVVGQRVRFFGRETGHRLDMLILRLTPTWVLLQRINQPESNVEIDVSLVSLDASATTNQEKPQFDIGGQG